MPGGAVQRVDDRVEALVLRQRGHDARSAQRFLFPLAHLPREADDRDAGTFAEDRPCDLGRIKTRQAVIENDDIGPHLDAGRRRPSAVLNRPDDRDVWTQAEEQLEGVAELVVVFDEEKLERRRVARGRQARRVPAPAAGQSAF
jgi:hypothetical protein